LYFRKTQFQNNPASSLNCKEISFQENLPESAGGPYKTNVQNDSSKRMCKTPLQNEPVIRMCKANLQNDLQKAHWNAITLYISGESYIIIY